MVVAADVSPTFYVGFVLSLGTLAALFSVSVNLYKRLYVLEQSSKDHLDKTAGLETWVVTDAVPSFANAGDRLEQLERQMFGGKTAPPPEPDPIGPDPTDMLSGVAGLLEMSAQRLEHIAAGLSQDQSTGLLLRDEAAKLRRMAKDADPDAG